MISATPVFCGETWERPADFGLGRMKSGRGGTGAVHPAELLISIKAITTKPAA
jgi:hypothetical protein